MTDPSPISAAAPLIVHRPVLGIGLRAMSVFLFAAMAVCVRYASTDAPVGQIVFFRSVFALAPILVYLWLRGDFPAGLRTRRPGGHALRSLLGCAAMFLAFIAVANLPLATYTAIMHLTPLLTVAAAILFLRERPGPVLLVALAAGLTGVGIILWPAVVGAAPGPGDALLGATAGLVGVVFTAGALAQTRRLTLTEKTGAIATYFSITCALVGLVTLPFGWVVPDPAQLAFLVGAGLLGGFAQIAMTEAFAHAPASTLAPLEYTAMVWAILFDIALFALWPGGPMLLGAGIIVAAAALATFGARR